MRSRIDLDVDYEGHTYSCLGWYDPGVKPQPSADEPGCGPTFDLVSVYDPASSRVWHGKLEPPYVKAFEGFGQEEWLALQRIALEKEMQG